MRLFITSDADWESRTGRLIDELGGSGFQESFVAKTYGRGVGVFRIVVMCRRPGVEFHHRRRYQAGPAIFGMDVFLSFEAMRDATMEERRRILAQGVCNDVQTVFAQRKTPIPDFDVHAFLADLQREFTRLGWLERPAKAKVTSKPRRRKETPRS